MKKPIQRIVMHLEQLHNDANDTLTQRSVQLQDSAVYPLARKVKMPESFGYETGALSFRLQQLILEGTDQLQWEFDTPAEKDQTIKLKLSLEQVKLTGTYALGTKPDPIVTMDTAGNLEELPEEACHPQAAGANDSGDNTDPQVEQWLDQARDERKRLMDTDNGIRLLDLYNEHNEIYEEVFRENTAMKTTWKAGGVTKAMSTDTSEAVANNLEINAKSYVRSDTQQTVTYNNNAFTQQLALAMNTAMQDPDYDPFESDSVPQGKYLEAAKATLSFGKVVKGNTDNDKQNINPLKPDDVYSTVDSHQGDLPTVDDREVNQLVQQGANPGGGEGGDAMVWTVLDEEDRSMLRTLFESNLKERAEKSNFVGRPLFEGTCFADIGKVNAEVELSVGEVGSEAVVVKRLDLPAFALEIDDSKWTGDIGKFAAERLEGIYFIRSLLYNDIVQNVERYLREMILGRYRKASASL